MPIFSEVSLRTERLQLRPLREDDSQALYDMFSDERVMRFWSTAPWQGIEEAEKMISRDVAAMSAGEYIRFGIERSQDAILVGQCTLFKLDAQCRRAEIGYSLRYDYWHQGYMHEALVALLKYGFCKMDLNRVEADIDPRNAASARSLVASGFKEEGQLRERWIVNGEVQDSAIYGLLRSEWKLGLGNESSET